MHRPHGQDAKQLHPQGGGGACEQTHEVHAHVHGEACGHAALHHAGHVDYLHDGHLHHPHGGHLDEHTLEVDDAHPKACTPEHACREHGEDHRHGKGCGHELVPHGDHHDYLVGSHLHHPHDLEHCDDHGHIELDRVAWLAPGGP